MARLILHVTVGSLLLHPSSPHQRHEQCGCHCCARGCCPVRARLRPEGAGERGVRARSAVQEEWRAEDARSERHRASRHSEQAIRAEGGHHGCVGGAEGSRRAGQAGGDARRCCEAAREATHTRGDGECAGCGAGCPGGAEAACDGAGDVAVRASSARLAHAGAWLRCVGARSTRLAIIHAHALHQEVGGACWTLLAGSRASSRLILTATAQRARAAALASEAARRAIDAGAHVGGTKTAQRRTGGAWRARLCARHIDVAPSLTRRADRRARQVGVGAQWAGPRIGRAGCVCILHVEAGWHRETPVRLHSRCDAIGARRAGHADGAAGGRRVESPLAREAGRGSGCQHGGTADVEERSRRAHRANVARGRRHHAVAARAADGAGIRAGTRR